MASGCSSSPVASTAKPVANAPVVTSDVATRGSSNATSRGWIDGPREERGAYHAELGARVHICVPAPLASNREHAGILFELHRSARCDEAPRVLISGENYFPRDAADVRPPWHRGRILQLDYSRQLITRVTDFEADGEHWIEVERTQPFEHVAITCAAACSTDGTAAIPDLVQALTRICSSMVFEAGGSDNLQAPKGTCSR